MRLSFTYKSLLIFPIIGGFLWNTNTPNTNGFSPIMGLGDTLTEAQKRLPENAVRNLTITEGVEAQLFASEPVMTNPTNIDVDERGRVWVCEAYNYRNAITGSPAKKEGDRILILEDTNGDGKADKNTVFYQGAEIESPLGIWVMGNQVIVSQSPYVWLFTDENGDDKADKKEILLQGMGGTQHDHGMHAFTFGPDGKFYFNFGNEGQTLKDKNNNVLRDKQGKDISLANYRMGMVFRCNPDMTEIEVLGSNFRNNYEVAVDSYGAMWQSDNDDDGNKGVRINYVMDYGNYGYTDEMTGAGWQVNRTNIETEIPFRHWHLNDPGVVPNLLQTGAGSPTGMCIYEGNLLPSVFHNQMIHCDAGPNVVRAYPVEKIGAGYTAKIVNIMEGTDDKWFRPSDVCVAPDGSLMVADWYDPGVGGHQAGDLNRGRIFRLSPPNTPYKIPTYDYSTTEGAIAALQNPNLSVRWHAWQVLHKMGEKANEPLLKLYLETPNSRVKARAFWLLAKSKNADKSIEMAMVDNNPDIRIAAIRAARQGEINIAKVVRGLYDDPDPQVRRECMIAMRDSTWEETIQLLCHLALQYDGKDRWYLEALGIGAEGQWDALIEKIIYNDNKIKLTKEARADIIWRSRGEKSAMLLGELASDNTVPLKDRLRYFRAYDFIPSKNKSQVLLGIVKQNNPEVTAVALRHLDADFVKNNAESKKILRDLMVTLKGKEYIEFAEKYALKEEHERLLMMINKNEFSRQASDILFKNTEGVSFVKAIVENPTKEAEGINLLSAMRWTGGKKQLDMLNAAAFNTKRSLNFRTKAFEYLGGSWGGEDMVLQYFKAGKIDQQFIPAAVLGVSKAWRKQISTEASKFLPNASTTPTETANKLPKIEDLMALKSDEKQGLILFKDYCSTCHQVKNEGVDFGPKLTNIGAKLSKEGQYAAILTPDAGISFGYEGWEIKTKDGSTYRGIITSTTAVELQLKSIGGSVQMIKIKDIKAKNMLSNSLMTAGFHEVLKPQELADLVGYLMSLK